ncbi:MAG: SDR family oxidoreductase [Myxococcota bacterium]
MSRPRTILVTGFPSTFLAVRVVQKLLLEEPTAELRCVVQEKSVAQATELLQRIDLDDRVRIIVGDIAAMDLGLSGGEFRTLANEVDVIHHCAAVTYLGVDRKVAEQVNIGGAREVLELAEAARHVERLVHWSTALVAGGRRGYVLEEELTAPQGFRNVIEETRFRGERIIKQASAHIPTTVIRPSIIVGDSVTGEIDRMEGPYLLVLLMLNAPPELRVPMPTRGDIPLNLVPIDYVVDAAMTIVRDSRSLGKTFHIVDPNPLSARKVFELIAQTVGRPLPRGVLPTALATTILKTPGLDRFAHVPRAFLEQLATEVVYDDRNSREILAGSTIHCPRFEDYVPTLVDYARSERSESADASEAARLRRGQGES